MIDLDTLAQWREEAVRGIGYAENPTNERRILALMEELAYWQGQSAGFMKAAIKDLGRYHRLRGRLNALSDEWAGREVTDSEHSMYRELRAAITEGNES